MGENCPVSCANWEWWGMLEEGKIVDVYVGLSSIGEKKGWKD
jgi:hypothetical protein